MDLPKDPGMGKLTLVRTFLTLRASIRWTFTPTGLQCSKAFKHTHSPVGANGRARVNSTMNALLDQGCSTTLTGVS